MNKQIISLIAVVAVFIVGVYVYKLFVSDTGKSAENQSAVIDREDLKLSFKYNEDGSTYQLSQTNADVAVLDGYMRGAFVLTNKQEHEAIQNNSAGEGPKSMSLFVFEKTSSSTVEGETREDRLRKWAQVNDAITGINRTVSEVESTELDGVSGLRFVSDGLYQNDTYLFGRGKLVYLFIGQFDSKDDVVYRDFQKLLASVSFY